MKELVIIVLVLVTVHECAYAQSEKESILFKIPYYKLSIDSIDITTKYLRQVKKMIAKKPELVNNIFIENLGIINKNGKNKQLDRKILDFQMDINPYLSKDVYSANIESVVNNSTEDEITAKIAEYIVANKPQYNYYVFLQKIINKLSIKTKIEIKNEFVEMLKIEKPSRSIRENTWNLAKALAKAGDKQAVEYVIAMLEHSKNSSSRFKIIEQVGLLQVRELTNYLIESVLINDFSEESYKNPYSDMSAVLSVIYQTINDFRNAPPRAVGEKFTKEFIMDWFYKNKYSYSFIKTI